MNNIFEQITEQGGNYTAAASSIMALFQMLNDEERNRLIDELVDYYADHLKQPADLPMPPSDTFTVLPTSGEGKRVNGKVTGPVLRRWITSTMPTGVWMTCRDIQRETGIPHTTVRQWFERFLTHAALPLEKDWQLTKNGKIRKIWFRKTLTGRRTA